MAQYKKRTKQVEEMVNSVNKYLRVNKLKDENDHLFSWLCMYLLDKKMYKGYNFYVEKKFQSVSLPILAGSADKGKYDFLQIY